MQTMPVPPVCQDPHRPEGGHGVIRLQGRGVSAGVATIVRILRVGIEAPLYSRPAAPLAGT